MERPVATDKRRATQAYKQDNFPASQCRAIKSALNDHSNYGACSCCQREERGDEQEGKRARRDQVTNRKGREREETRWRKDRKAGQARRGEEGREEAGREREHDNKLTVLEYAFRGNFSAN